MPLVELVAALAILQFLFFGAMTGRARGLSGLKAPAVTGHEGFERMYRVQMNTLELLIAYFPALFLAAKYWPPSLVAGVGSVYLVGRMIYWRAYIQDPSKRAPGFALSMFPTIGLTVLALVGILQAMLGAGA
jgi:uncharacterized MAPEG superfamily protein